MRMVISQLENMAPATRDEHRRHAEALLDGGFETSLLGTPPKRGGTRSA